VTEHPAGNPTTSLGAVPLWAKAMTNEADFRAEQTKLGQIWTFLGFASDVPGTNDWFRTTLGGRSIFVQRFETGISAFENRCAHRFFPLRTEDRGNGPVVCGFHHWRYNADGLALGIPKCQEMFGKTPREMDARLVPVEIGLCGPLIFGRFAGGPTVSLQEWLGEGVNILSHLVPDTKAAARIERVVAAHWKLIAEITLDDYHIVAVHPSSFGKTGYIHPETIHYVRFGAHSAYIPGGKEGAFADLVAACRAGTYAPHRYRIFQFFPNLIVAIVHTVHYLGESYWYLSVEALVPEAHDRTKSVTRFFVLPFEKPAGAWRRLARALARPWITLGLWYYARKIHLEDNEACEKLQTAAGLVNGPPTLAMQEARVGWFEEEYARFMAGDARTGDTVSEDARAETGPPTDR
jgi:phenylpropionate dioxygenase-like ring-hydroxylating dioxygenase large terminal subunit